MSKYTFDQKNDLCVANQTNEVEKYKKDLEYYKKLFPNSPNIHSFERYNEFNMLGYNGRMLLEMLDVVCIETLLENRDPELAKRAEEIKKQRVLDEINKKKAEKEAKANEMVEFAAVDIATMKYKDKKSIFLKMGLEAENQKEESITPVLIAEQNEVKAQIKQDQDIKKMASEALLKINLEEQHDPSILLKLFVALCLVSNPKSKNPVLDALLAYKSELTKDMQGDNPGQPKPHPTDATPEQTGVQDTTHEDDAANASNEQPNGSAAQDTNVPDPEKKKEDQQ